MMMQINGLEAALEKIESAKLGNVAIVHIDYGLTEPDENGNQEYSQLSISPLISPNLSDDHKVLREAIDEGVSALKESYSNALKALLEKRKKEFEKLQ